MKKLARIIEQSPFLIDDICRITNTRIQDFTHSHSDESEHYGKCISYTNGEQDIWIYDGEYIEYTLLHELVHCTDIVLYQREFLKDCQEIRSSFALEAMTDHICELFGYNIPEERLRKYYGYMFKYDKNLYRNTIKERSRRINTLKEFFLDYTKHESLLKTI